MKIATIIRVFLYGITFLISVWLIFTHDAPSLDHFFESHGIDPLIVVIIVSNIIFILWFVLPALIMIRAKAPFLAAFVFWILGIFAIAFGQQVSCARAMDRGDMESAMADTAAGGWIAIGWFPSVIVGLLGHVYYRQRPAATKPPQPTAIRPDPTAGRG